MKRTFHLILFIVCFSKTSFLFSQNNYNKGWEYLNNADFDNALIHFEKATKENSSKEKAQLVLTMLYSVIDKHEKASTFFNEYYDNNPNPYDALFALWFEEGLMGQPKKYKSFQLNLLKKVENDSRTLGKFDAITKYRLSNHYTFAYDTLKVKEYNSKISSIDKWSLVGPFDNVMNSGYNKDFGVLQNPEKEKSFQSKYGAEVKWFVPPTCTWSGYFFKDYNFYSSNSIVYAQSFVESAEERDVIMKFGYSGSLKVWLNDSLAYSEPNRRMTEIDYFQVKCHLNKGFNRILIQLGDYEEAYPNFILRFTDLNQKALNLSNDDQFHSYQKNKGTFTQIPFFAVESLQKKLKINPDDILNRILLAKTYLRANDMDAVENIITSLNTAFPKNYLVLRLMINFYQKSNNTTQQNKTYEIYKELYPQDFDVLLNDIKEAIEQKDKNKSKELIDVFKAKYPYSEYQNNMYELSLFGLDENIDKIVSKVDEIHKKYPNDYTAIISKYQIQKALTNSPKESNSILEDYLKDNYNFAIIETLASDYIAQGRIDDAIAIIEKSKSVVNDDLEVDRKIVNLLSRKRDYDMASKICQEIIQNRPSDYTTLADLAMLHKLKNEKQKAISYYEEALRYFPFSFDNNERIRELKGLKAPFDLVEAIVPNEIITDYEKNFVSKNKKSYDIVIDKKTLVVFKTKATGSKRTYLVKINQESAIEEWQKLQLRADANMNLQINEAKTIKKNGNKIEAERNGNDIVFTNLEVGDYIYVDYTQKQVDGGKSSLFINDVFALNAYKPNYKINYNILVENGVILRDTSINLTIKPQITTSEGFKKYTWNVTSPDMLKEESFPPPFNDIAAVIHTSLDYQWKDIAQWYSDLSGQQAQPDFTIQMIVKELFEGKSYTDEEKAKIIYQFVCKNIQYSSIDFRQSNFIPQKASDVYHTRLGDCKDLSTLYASIARTAGLDVNLILINTRDNGQKDVILPSLNFNHCIVKVNLKSGSKYLELTDPDLPYGYLYYYHNEASILEIPTKINTKYAKLSYLKLNSGFQNKIIRSTNLKVNANNSLESKINVTKIGAEAGNACKIYYNSDDTKRRDDLKKELSAIYKSSIKINSFSFEKLEPRADSAKFTYDFTVENEVMKVGSFKTLKIPFSDVLAKLNIFEEGERTFDFNYNYYEPSDFYDESFTVNLDNSLKILEIPENIHLSFNGNRYDLEFQKINDQQMKVKRVYQVERKNISTKEFSDFKTFITKIIEAENTSLVFK